MTKVFLLTAAQFSAAEEQRHELARSRPDGAGASLREILAPGAMWEVPWYFDPGNPDGRERRRRALEAIEAGEPIRDYLSRHYWLDWSDKRPPLCVLCPNGAEWCLDSKSSNGTGWAVTGAAPLITAAPSILVPGYHGFLRDGVFTPDIDNRGAAAKP